MAVAIKIKGGPNFGISLTSMSVKDEMLLNTDNGHFKIGKADTTWANCPEYGQNGKGVRVDTATGNWMVWNGTAWQNTGQKFTKSDRYIGNTTVALTNSVVPSLPLEKQNIIINADRDMTFTESAFTNMVFNSNAGPSYKIYIKNESIVARQVDILLDGTIFVVDASVQNKYVLSPGRTMLIEVEKYRTNTGPYVTMSVQCDDDIDLGDPVRTWSFIRQTNKSISGGGVANVKGVEIDGLGGWQLNGSKNAFLIDTDTIFFPSAMKMASISTNTSWDVLVTGDAGFIDASMESFINQAKFMLMPDKQRVFIMATKGDLGDGVHNLYFGYMNVDTLFVTTIDFEYNGYSPTTGNKYRIADFTYVKDPVTGAEKVYIINTYGYSVMTQGEEKYGLCFVNAFHFATNTFSREFYEMSIGDAQAVKIVQLSNNKVARFFFNNPDNNELSIHISDAYDLGNVDNEIPLTECYYEPWTSEDNNPNGSLQTCVVGTVTSGTGDLVDRVYFPLTNIGYFIIDYNPYSNDISFVNGNSVLGVPDHAMTAGQMPVDDYAVMGIPFFGDHNYAVSLYNTDYKEVGYMFQYPIESMLMLPDGSVFMMCDANNYNARIWMFMPDLLPIKPGKFALDPFINKSC